VLKATPIAKSSSDLLAKAFGWIPLHPNTITALSIVFAVAGFALLFHNQPAAGFAFFILAFLSDGIDGAVARAKGLTSKKGAFLDGISDRLVEFFLVLALFVSTADTTTHLLLVSILFFGTCMTAFVKAYAEHSGLMGNDSAKKMPGILERAERSVLLLLVPLLMLLGAYRFVVPLLALIALLSIATFLQRLYLVLSLPGKG
jgi:phosphatidylglycerophosphate synthase